MGALIPIGLHIPTNGDAAGALETFAESGAKAAQVLCGDPHRFNASHRPIRHHQSDLVVVAHATYVINLADPAPRTMPGILSQVEWSNNLGADFLVIHSGSTKKQAFNDSIFEAYRERIRTLVSHASDDLRILIENSASARPGSRSGSLGSIRTLAQVLDGLLGDRVAICLDIAHAWAAGEDLRSLLRVKKSPFIPLIHSNVADKNVRYGAHLDRHGCGLDGGVYRSDLVVEILASLQPEAAIVESNVVTIEECHDLALRVQEAIDARSRSGSNI